MRSILISLVALLWLPTLATADVVVLANRARQVVHLRITPTGAKPYMLMLQSGQVTPLFSDSKLRLTYQSPEGLSGYRLDANCAYWFGESDGGVRIHRIGLGGQGDYSRELPGGGVTTPAGVINVRICVDDDEPSHRAIWEQKLRSRIDQASAILLAHCGMTLRVIDAGEWITDNAVNDFQETLAEFEQAVTAPPGGVAIGFTSQYQVMSGRTHLGGTRGPLSSHILLREWSRHASESERLELLVHELGHYLGAAHSPEPDSVMRPVLGGTASRLQGHAIRFDPVNTLAMAMLGEEVRRRKIKRLEDITPATRARLNQIYTTLAQALPDDTAAARYAARTLPEKTVSQAELAKTIILAAVEAGADNQRLPRERREEGDYLTEEIVRRAAGEAIAMRHHAPQALLFGLAIALDDSGTLRAVPATGQLAREVDPPGAMAERKQLIGRPTMRSRHDLMKHFFVSAALTAAMDAERAHAFGLSKELVDANLRSGFSFVDLAADRAGVRFAQAVLSGKLTMVHLADEFSCDSFLPDMHDLPEGLSNEQFIEQFGGAGDKRFLAKLREIEQRISDLPGYLP